MAFHRFRLVLCGCAAWLGCEGSHTDLAQDSSSASTGGGGGGGVGGAGGIGGTGGAPAVVEPDGPPRLTVVNAIVDRPSLQLCFMQSPASPGDDAEPWPAEPLAYARADASGPPLPASDVEILVLTGDLDAIEGSGCREIADDPGAFGGLELLSIGVAPAATFSAPRSTVIAVTGCFGGAGHDGDQLESICGVGYSAEAPTPGVVIAPLSRFTSPGAIGFQVVNAIGSGATADVYVRPSFDGVLEVPIASAVVSGAAAPFPPNGVLAAAELGSPEAAFVRTSVGTGAMTIELELGDALDNGGLGGGDFANGRNVALLLAGPAPGSATGSWWNDFAVVALDTDPDPDSR